MDMKADLSCDASQRALITGRVFSIQHYCVHDGPGIRTNVFLKGCPLRCRWCANPESQRPERQHMYRRNLCAGCGACVAACARGAITMAEDGAASVDFSRCVGCGACAGVCPKEAHVLMGESKTARDVFTEIQKDALFYGRDGGVTVTGGEPLEQPDFVQALLMLCREAGFTTAMETSGLAPWKVVERLSAWTDTFLYDVKVMDADLHKRFTGCDNAVILENLARLSDACQSAIIVRTPVVCGCNDTEENMRKLGAFVRDHVKRCHEAQLLPYHSLGLDKYAQLGVSHKACEFQTPGDAEMERLRDVLREYIETVK